jgi:peptidoglycan/xylan/chitin deacetylase (PgdA/CDA1 family)
MIQPAAPTPKPLSKRARVARALDLLGLLDRLLWLRARLGIRALTVLTYHRVGLPGDEDGLNREVIEVEPEELAKQIEMLKEHCTIVGLADVRRFRSGGRIPPNPVLLTFDDGYADNHRLALPILRRAGVAATFFIPTAYPDAGRLFWWDKIALLFHRCVKESVELTYPERQTLHPRLDPAGATERVCAAIKRTLNVSMSRVWEDLERALGCAISVEEESATARRTIMGWSEIRALAAAGMDVQSHSHRHIVLNTLSPEEAERDLRQSSSILREAVDQPVHSIAYPVGYELEGALRRAPESAAFDLGFTNNTGLCALRRFDPFNVPRLSMDVQKVGALYKLLLTMGDGLLPATRRLAPSSSLH